MESKAQSVTQWETGRLQWHVWAWPVDGYFDLHHAEFGINPDGSDVVRECFATLEEVKQYVREIAQWNKWTL